MQKINLKLENIERLLISELEENYGNFEKCEGKWKQDSITSDISKIKLLFDSCQKVNLQMRGQKLPYYEWENVKNKLEAGETVQDMYNIYRIRTKFPKCANCGRSIVEGLEAHSRTIPNMVLCSQCGEREALEDFYGCRG